MTEEQTRRGYHHGDLKTALIQATIDLIRDRPIEEVSVADAARAAHVSSGAPYRHFKDREDLLAHVAAEGFRQFHEVEKAAFAAHPPNSVEGLIASGCAYAEFGADNPELFHLMWGSTRHLDTSDVARAASATCYGYFIEKLHGIMRERGLSHLDPHQFGAPLWALVHGFASLLIGQPAMLEGGRQAVRDRIAEATWAYFRGHETDRESRTGAGG